MSQDYLSTIGASVRRSTRLVAATAAIATSAALVATSATAATPTDTSGLRDAVTVDGVMNHERALQAIADANGGTRASGTPGYAASVGYVEEQLETAGYDVTTQEFPFLFFRENSPAEFQRISPDPEVYVVGTDFVTMEYSGSGDVTGDLTPIDVQEPPPATPGSTSGCEAGDFPDPGADFDVALIQRGTCTFFDKAANAEAAGYDAVVIYNEGQDGRQDTLSGTLGEPVGIPVIGTSYAIGRELLQKDATADGAVVRVRTDTESEERTTWNVIAESTGGRTDRTVVVGAHLDSVLEGPGINDNGSGSSTILEVARQMADTETTNQVRFAFWGAEESGLVGSEYYVSQLTKREIKDIAVNLNFDMVGSPNYARFVYDGDGSDTAVKGPTGSANVEDVFTDYFDSQGLVSEPTEFSGRSDYGPFIAVGIPAGGLFTGAEGVKTEEQADPAVFGGLSTFGTNPDGSARAVAYDPCYHQGCDSLTPDYADQGADQPYYQGLYTALEAEYTNEYGPSPYTGGEYLDGNVNLKGLDEMSDAAAHGTLTFAMTSSAVGGTAKGGGSSVQTDSMEFKGSHLRK